MLQKFMDKFLLSRHDSPRRYAAVDLTVKTVMADIVERVCVVKIRISS